MIIIKIVEHPGENLQKELLRAMRSDELRTFNAKDRGKKIVHLSYAGWMNWARKDGVITCKVKNPSKPHAEWQFMHAFVGRLADRYPDYIESLTIEFPNA